MPMSAQALPVAVRVIPRLLIVACILAVSAGCALVQRKAVGMVASTLASSGDVFTRDDDLELVGDAIPFGLKLYESLLDSAPKNKDLLIATCSNFTQYGVAYVETEAAGPRRSAASRRGRAPEPARAQVVLAREGLLPAGDGGAFPGDRPEAADRSGPALAKAQKKDVPLLLDGRVLGIGNRPRHRPARPGD